jgi:hypothetical protein
MEVSLDDAARHNKHLKQSGDGWFFFTRNRPTTRKFAQSNTIRIEPASILFQEETSHDAMELERIARETGQPLNALETAPTEEMTRLHAQKFSESLGMTSRIRARDPIVMTEEESVVHASEVRRLKRRRLLEQKTSLCEEEDTNTIDPLSPYATTLEAIEYDQQIAALKDQRAINTAADRAEARQLALAAIPRTTVEQRLRRRQRT